MNQMVADAPLNPMPFKPLGSARSLDFLPQACLGLRFGRQTCARCETACPVQAIRLDESALALHEHCVGCGRCVAACPAGALRAKGFDMLPAATMTTAVAVECWKVSPENGKPGSFRVPCLGGLTKSALLTLLLGAQGNPVRLLDRGWCRNCAAGGGQDHPAEALVAEVGRILDKLGAPPAWRPQIINAPLPARLMPVDIPPPMSQQAFSRRGFFKALLTETVDAVAHASAWQDKVEATARGMDRVHPAGFESRRIASLIMQLAQRTATQPSAAWFPSVELGPSCCNHGICAAACPAGALRRYEDGEVSGVQFDPALCLACGVCMTVCPEHAVRLLPEGNRDHSVEPVRLNRYVQTACPACGKNFSKTSQSQLCSGCERRRRMGESLFGTLFAKDGT